MGFEHFPCTKCQVLIDHPRAMIGFIDTATGKPFIDLDYFTVAAPEDFKVQFLLLHP